MRRATVSGRLDTDAIRTVARRHLGEIQYCYVSIAVAADPKRAGSVQIDFTVSDAGTVSNARIGTSTLGHAPTEACFLSAVRRWRFPKPPDGKPTHVKLPFQLRP